MRTFGTAADDEVVSLHEQFYIQATSSRADDRTRVLKSGETFAVFDRFGDLQPVGLGEQGIYHDGTRFLSGWCGHRFVQSGERWRIQVRQVNLIDCDQNLRNPSIVL